MSVPSPYLDGFLAAALPVDRATGDALPATTPPARVVASREDIPTDRSSSDEEITRRLGPLDSFPRLLDCVSANRPPDTEDCLRFQWFGLFYEAPAQDAFRLRLRLPGGRLRPFQIAGLAEITQRFAGGQVVLNARGGLDLPGVPITSACRILFEAEGIGLSARRTGGDCVQAVRGGEYDGFDPGSKRPPVYPLVCALEQALALGSAFADLPSPCEIVFQSGGEVMSDPTIDTLVLREAGHQGMPSAEDDFVLLPMSGSRNGFLLAAEAVVPGCLSLLEAWRSEAGRSSRENADLARFLDKLGPDALCALLGGAKPISPLPKLRAETRTHPPGLAVPGMRLLSRHLAALERCCLEHGWREIRLARGHLHAVTCDDVWVEATAVLTRALSA